MSDAATPASTPPFRGRTYALDATCAQQRALFGEAARCRWGWNRAVALERRLQRIAAEAKAAGRPVPAFCCTGYPALCRRLTVWRRRRPWLAARSVVPQQQALKTYAQAAANFRTGRALRPAFKKRRDPLGLRYPLPHARLADPAPDVCRLALAKVPGVLRVRRSSPDLGAVRHVTVALDGARWVASVCYAAAEVPAPTHAQAAALAAGAPAAAVGLDCGVARTWTSSHGGVVQMPRPTPAEERRVRRLQRQRGRRRKGSRRWGETVRRQARLARRLARWRREQVRHLARDLVRDHALVVFEELAISRMTRRPRDRSGAPNGRAAKAALNRWLLEGAYRQTLEEARWQARKTGARVVTVPAAGTSQTCAACGHRAPESRESQAVFRCAACGHAAHADDNASVNIEQAGRRQAGVSRRAFAPEQCETSPPGGRRRETPGEPGAARAAAVNLEPAGRSAGLAPAG